MPSQQEFKTGIIDSFYDDDSGTIREDLSGDVLDFFHPGAKVDFILNEKISFLKITTPKGKVIIRDIGRPA